MNALEHILTFSYSKKKKRKKEKFKVEYILMCALCIFIYIMHYGQRIPVPGDSGIDAAS